MKSYFLAVEDSLELLAVLQAILNTPDHIVISATTIAQAQTIIQQRHFDIALLDEILPDGNTTSLIPELSRQGCSIILMSGNIDCSSSFFSLPYPKLQKPFRLAKLSELVESLILEKSALSTNT